MPEQGEQLVARLRQEIQMLREEVNTKDKYLTAQKQTNENSKNQLTFLRSKNQAQKEKIIQLENTLKEANLQREELRDNLREANQKLEELQSRIRKNKADITLEIPQSIGEDSIVFNRCVSQQKTDKNFPSGIGQLSVFDKSNNQQSKKKVQSADQKKRESQLLSFEITITALEQKVKKLQAELEASARDKETLKKRFQILSLEKEKKQDQQAVLDSLLLQDNNYFSMDKIVENRKLYLESQDEEERMLMAPKSVHKSIFKSIMGHLDTVDQNKKMPFLQMLNVWSEQKLQRIYKSLQQLR